MKDSSLMKGTAKHELKVGNLARAASDPTPLPLDLVTGFKRGRNGKTCIPSRGGQE